MYNITREEDYGKEPKEVYARVQDRSGPAAGENGQEPDGDRAGVRDRVQQLVPLEEGVWRAR